MGLTKPARRCRQAPRIVVCGHTSWLTLANGAAVGAGGPCGKFAVNHNASLMHQRKAHTAGKGVQCHLGVSATLPVGESTCHVERVTLA